MGRKRIDSNQSLKKNNSLSNVQILIVDDDSTSLAIVSSMLKTFSLQDHLIELSVVTVKNSIEALSTIRAKNITFDLVITDLHIPGINGWELQKRIDEEFKIPVIVMSSNSKESDVLKSLESGAIFHMVKPVNQQDLKNVWQYAVASKKGKAVATDQEMESNVEEDTASSESSVDGDNTHKRKYGKKRSRDNGDEDAPTNKKAKVVWTNSLHARFLQAINHIGLEKAVPKRILDFMNVPGLTRENVASHLQKYRLFLKKVTERGFWSSQTLSERTLRSSFATGYSNFRAKNYHQDFPAQHLTTFQPGYGANLSGPGSSSHSFSRYPIQEASSSNSAPPFRYGQSSLLGSSFHRPTFNTSPFYQSSYGVQSNNATTGFPMYQQQHQSSGSSSSFQNNFNPPPYFPFNSSSSANVGTINNSSLASFNPNSNYAGIRLNSNGELGTGLIRLDGNGFSTGFGAGYDSMNWTNANTNNNNLNNEPVAGNGIFGFVPSHGGFSSSSPSSSSSTGFGGFSSSSSTMFGNSSTQGGCSSSSSGFANYLAQGGSSSSSSTLFGNANQFSPLFAFGNQETTTMPPPLAEQNTINMGNSGEENDFTFNILNNDASSTLDNVANDQQELEEADLELFFGSSNYTTPYQPQGDQRALNIGSPYQAGLNTSVNELLNFEFSNSCTLTEKAPWNEQSSGQFQSTEEMVNANFSDNVSFGEDYFPTFEQPQVNLEEHINSDINGIHQETAKSDENQGWGEDFLDFFLGNDSC